VVSICAVVLLVLGSLSNVVGYQSVKSRGTPESNPKMQMGPGYINWTVNGTMGENGWYISPITLTCTYDHDVWAHIYYDIGNGTTEYTGPFNITNQGLVNFMYIAVDYEGNSSPPGIFPTFKIDYTPPYIDLSVELVLANGCFLLMQKIVLVVLLMLDSILIINFFPMLL
jgi:hypothetical protein